MKLLMLISLLPSAMAEFDEPGSGSGEVGSGDSSPPSPPSPPPLCNPGCPSNWIEDNFCDYSCNVPQCNYDGGDCALSPPVPPSSPVDLCSATTYFEGISGNLVCYLWLDAGHSCSTKWSDICENDAPGGADQNNVTLSAVVCGQCSQPSPPSPPPLCNPGCPSYWIGDNYCDSSCNVPQCNYDGGDCALSPPPPPPSPSPPSPPLPPPEFDKCARPSGTWAGFDQVDTLCRPALLTLRAHHPQMRC